MALTQECKYFIYSHTREDRNEVFYIGLGTKAKGNTIRRIYTRAFDYHKGNPYWSRVVNKTSYKVEILEEFNSLDKVKSREIELIAKFKRKVDGGYLTNVSTGGESNSGCIAWNKGKKISQDTRDKLSKANIGKKLSEDTKRKMSEAHKGKKKNYSVASRKKVVNTETKIIYNSALEAFNSSNLPIKYRAFTDRINKGRKHFKYAYVNQ